MTTIVGIEHEGKVYLAADHRCVSGWQLDSSTESKLWRRFGMLIGVAGMVRYRQLLQFVVEPPRPQEPEENDLAYLVSAFVPNVRKTLTDVNHIGKDDDGEKASSLALFGYRGRLYELATNFTVSTFERGYHAIGSGREYALGALAVMTEAAPMIRVRKAVEIAAMFDMGTDSRVDIESE